MSPPLTPGAYIRIRREADQLTVDDVAYGLDSDPPVSHRHRTELLAAIEADLVPVSIATAAALQTLLSIDLELLGELVEAHDPQTRPPAPPRLRRAARTPLFVNIGGEAGA